MQYLVAIYRPYDYDDTREDAAMAAAIDALNRDMVAAGVRSFVGGLQPIRRARSLRASAAGDTVITDGPFSEAKEYMGGFWVLDVADLDAALDWGGRAATACRAPVEVRPFY